jgi:formylglycine-generating enzyme required for sulfatase activity
VIHSPVGVYGFNPFGLYDVHGNVWEWCSDLYASSTDDRVMRGGCFSMEARIARSSRRDNASPEFHAGYVGLRAARELHQVVSGER